MIKVKISTIFTIMLCLLEHGGTHRAASPGLGGKLLWLHRAQDNRKKMGNHTLTEPYLLHTDEGEFNVLQTWQKINLHSCYPFLETVS